MRRDAVDRAVIAAALEPSGGRHGGVWHRPEGALALTLHPVDDRIAALLDRHPPTPDIRRLCITVAVVVLALSVLGTLDGAIDAAQLFHATSAATAT